MARSLQGRGITGSLMMIFMRYYHKFIFREMDLWGKIEPDHLDGPDEIKMHARRYEATDPRYFKKLFENLKWPFSKSIFIDFGCGKGASLVYASGYKFKKLIGVEFSEQLTGTARENLKKQSDLSHGNIDFEIINTDAGKYEIPIEADCFYFFNPFDEIVLDQVMMNIRKSLDKKYRKIMILYMNAIHSNVIEKHSFVKVKYLSPGDLDIYYPGGAYVYTN